MRSASVPARIFHTLELTTYSMVLGPLFFTMALIGIRGFMIGDLTLNFARKTLLSAYFDGFGYFLFFGLVCGVSAAFLNSRRIIVPITTLAMMLVAYNVWDIYWYGFEDLSSITRTLTPQIMLSTLAATILWWSIMSRFDVL